jgi:hypothetical protein
MDQPPSDFGTMNHTRKQWSASVRIGSEVRKRHVLLTAMLKGMVAVLTSDRRGRLKAGFVLRNVRARSEPAHRLILPSEAPSSFISVLTWSRPFGRPERCRRRGNATDMCFPSKSMLIWTSRTVRRLRARTRSWTTSRAQFPLPWSWQRPERPSRYRRLEERHMRGVASYK